MQNANCKLQNANCKLAIRHGRGGVAVLPSPDRPTPPLPKRGQTEGSGHGKHNPTPMLSSPRGPRELAIIGSRLDDANVGALVLPQHLVDAC